MHIYYRVERGGGWAQSIQEDKIDMLKSCISHKYKQTCRREEYLSTDFEKASFGAYEEVFGENAQLTLCGVHYLRAVKKNLIDKVGKKNIFSDKVLSEIWYSMIKGSQWIDWRPDLIDFYFLKMSLFGICTENKCQFIKIYNETII